MVALGPQRHGTLVELNLERLFGVDELLLHLVRSGCYHFVIANIGRLVDHALPIQQTAIIDMLHICSDTSANGAF